MGEDVAGCATWSVVVIGDGTAGRSEALGALSSGVSSKGALPGPAPAVPLPPVTPADLLRISDCIPQVSGSKVQKYRK